MGLHKPHCVSTVAGVLKRELSMSFRKVSLRQISDPGLSWKLERAQFALLMLEIVLQGFEMIFVDEFSVGRLTPSNYTWAVKGKNTYITMPPITKSHSYMVAASPTRPLALMVKSGTNTSNDFSQFISHFVS